MTTQASREALLRTTADVLDHAVVQAMACVEEWPEVVAEVEAVARAAAAVAQRAGAVGYVPRARP